MNFRFELGPRPGAVRASQAPANGLHTLRMHDPDNVEGAVQQAAGPDGLIAGLRRLREAGLVTGMLTQGARGARPPWPRDCIGFPPALPVGFAWDLMKVTYLWPPWLTGSYQPRLVTHVSFGMNANKGHMIAAPGEAGAETLAWPGPGCI